MQPRTGESVSQNKLKQSDSQLQLVTFGIGDEEYGVDILGVQEINRMMELARVPQAPPGVEGVINLRGRIIPVIDLRKRFGLAQAQTGDSSRIIVVEVLGRVLGFMVDRVHEVLRIDRSIVEPAPEMACSIDSDFIAGVGKLDGRLLILLDLEKLFDPNAIQSATTMAA
jgi:purine-binding chemotaxis protein CheW